MDLKSTQRELNKVNSNLMLYPKRLDLVYDDGRAYTLFKFEDGQVKPIVVGIIDSYNMYKIRNILERNLKI